MSELCALFAVVIEMDESYSEWMTIDVFWHVQLQCTKDNTNRAEQPTKSDIQREKPIITAREMMEYQIRCEKWTSANPNERKKNEERIPKTSYIKFCSSCTPI